MCGRQLLKVAAPGHLRCSTYCGRFKICQLKFGCGLILHDFVEQRGSWLVYPDQEDLDYCFACTLVTFSSMTCHMED